jgi:hypothetical protein
MKVKVNRIKYEKEFDKQLCICLKYIILMRLIIVK